MEKIRPPLLVPPEERDAHFRAQLERIRANGWAGGYPYETEVPREWHAPCAPALVARRGEIEADVERIDWPWFRTAYGDGASVPPELRRLLFGDLDAAMDATHHLWCSLCHQHAYLSSAALPAYPFIALALRHAPDSLAVEILDIVRGFANVRLSEFGIDENAWHASLGEAMGVDRALFARLAEHENDDVREFAQGVLATFTDG
jgi:hypothetical protein